MHSPLFTDKVKVTRSRGLSDSCWPRTRTRTKSPINTKISRMVAHPTGNNSHQFQLRSNVKVTRPINTVMESDKVCHIFRMGRSTNLKLGKQMEHEDLYH